MTLWDQAKVIHDEANLDYNEALIHHQQFGHIISSPDCLIWGEEDDGAWFVYLAIGQGALKTFVERQPYYLPYFAFCRALKGRIEPKEYPMKRVARLLGIDLSRIRGYET